MLYAHAHRRVKKIEMKRFVACNSFDLVYWVNNTILSQ